MSIAESPRPGRILLGNVQPKEEAYKPKRVRFEYIDDKGELWMIDKSAREPFWAVDPPLTESDLQLTIAKLSELQNPISEDPKEQAHSKNQEFLLSHWRNIRDAIRPSRKNGKIRPHAFTEVNFGIYGRADFIGIASDGTAVIIEVGTAQKATQLGRHALGFAEKIGKEIPIFPYAASYEKHGTTNILTMDLGYGALTTAKLPPPASSWK